MNVLFLGKDNRYEALIKYLSNKYNVECIGYKNYKLGSLDNIDKYNMIILPMYGIKNGKVGEITINQDIINKINDNCVIYTGLIPKELSNKKIISFMEDDEINIENNKITVDGMMEEIKPYDKSLICILGYGNIGKMVYDKLKDRYLVCVGVRNLENNYPNTFFETGNHSYLKNILLNSTLIINTVPKNIITDDIAPYIKGHVLDIASYPYGIDQKLLDKYTIDYHLYSSIPSKYDPERAGEILLKKF